jgi:hypothetical protein
MIDLILNSNHPLANRSYLVASKAMLLEIKKRASGPINTSVIKSNSPFLMIVKMMIINMILVSKLETQGSIFKTLK